MLQKIRDKATGWIAYTIIILIAIPFALWGVDSYFGGSGRQVVAEVNGEPVTQQALQQELRQQRDRLAQLFGGRLPEGALDEGALRDQALQTLIRRELLRQTARERGYRVSAQAVARELARIPVFQQDGTFDAERYARILEAQRLTPQAFEADLARGLVLEQLEAGVRETTPVTAARVAHYLDLALQVREVDHLHLPAPAWAPPREEIGDEAVQAYYNAHRDRFRAPERVRLDYVLLDPEVLEEDLSISGAELRRQYEMQRDRFTTPEERRAAQILIRVPEGADEDAVQAAREAAREARDRVQNGESFGKVAREVSDDRLTAGEGGDLGWLQRGDLGNALDGVLFTMAPGEVSHPVRTAEGFHLLKLESVRPPQTEPFEAVRERLEADLRARRAESRLMELHERLMTQAFEHPRSLEPAVAATGLEIQRSGWITRTQGEGIGTLEAVRKAAFSSQVLQEGQNSELIELSDGRAVILRVARHEPSRPRPLEAVEDRIRERIRTQEAGEAAEAAGRDLLKAVRAGEPLEAVAATLPVDVTVERLQLRRNSDAAPARVREAAFALDGAGAVTGVSLEAGDYALVQLHAVKTPEPDGEQRSRAREHLRRVQGSAEFEAVLRHLENGADIEIHRDRL
ncbi:SurA N-terminal domain-containing protein [Ectothiorhodospira mobilis]|uniref:SurA N-terminal domain-containing protein n=1 Tax=Ectothiorhodospira mobilis TaxID=195064 RepID=UPI001907CFA5|nr:SurA N-terminal domain-containing protein [Ectothiorhodospira mobilis]MBK1692985.1 peptidylprolyl isomerase [Ectothiorhodospira mobilis]